jgi:hypothetical protein
MKIENIKKIYLKGGSVLDIVDNGDYVTLVFDSEITNCVLLTGKELHSIKKYIAEKMLPMYAHTDKQRLGFAKQTTSPLQTNWAGILELTKDECQEIYITLALLSTKYNAKHIKNES